MSMDQIVTGLLSSENGVRSAAEAEYNKQMKENTIGTFEGLLGVLCNNSEVGCRSLAAVLLRRILQNEEFAPWGKLSDEQREKSKDTLLQSLSRDPQGTVRKKVALLVAHVAQLCQALEVSTGKGAWSDLLMKLVALCNNQEDKASRIAVMETFNYLAEYAQETVLPHSADFCRVVAPIMTNDPTLNVRISALEAVCSLLRSMESVGKEFQELVPGMMSVLVKALESNEEMVVQEGLKTLVEVVETHPRFLTGYLDGLGQLMNQIAGAASLEDDTRMLSVELLLNFAEKTPALLRKHTSLVQSIITVSMQLIAEGSLMEDETLENTEELDEDLSEMGQESLVRLSKAIGSKAVLPCAFEGIQTFIQDADWRKRRSGLLTIAMVSRHGGKVFFEKMQNIVQMVLPFLVKEPQSRVRFTAVRVLGELCESFRSLPELEKYEMAENEEGCNDDEELQLMQFTLKFSQPILEGLTHVLGDEKQSWKIREEAASSVLLFCSGCDDPELVAPFQEKLLENLFLIIQGGPISAKIEGLTAVSALASVIGVDFGKYYDHFMPIAKSLVSAQDLPAGSDGESTETLRGKAMDCVGLMGHAVPKEKFEPDARQVMDFLIQRQQQNNGANAENEDPTAKEYIVRASARICTAMGESFLPYLKYLIPPLIESAGREIEVTIEDAPLGDGIGEQESAPGMQMVDYHVRGLGGKRIGFNTWAAQEKELACNVLFTYAEGFGESFLEYVPQTAEVLIREIFSPMFQVRVAATCALPRLLSSISLGLKKNEALQPAAQNLFIEILKQLLQVIEFDDSVDEEDEEEEDEEVEDMLLIEAECVASVLRTAFESGGLTDSNVDVMLANDYNNGTRTSKFGVPLPEVSNVLKEIVTRMHSRVHKRLVAHQNLRLLGDEVDAQMMENYEEADKRLVEFMDSLSEGIGCIIKAHGPNIISEFSEICQPFADSLLTAEDMAAPLRAVGLFFYDDMIEYGGPKAQAFVEKGVPFMIKYADHENYLLRQAACYGLGVCAEHGGAPFDKFTQPTLEVLLRVIKAPESRKGTNSSATDNAISAVYKLCLYRKQEQVFGELLTLLPIDADRLEAKIIHYRLMQHLMQNDAFAQQHGNTIRQILKKAAASTKGYNSTKKEFDVDDAVLSENTRKYVTSI